MTREQSENQGAARKMRTPEAGSKAIQDEIRSEYRRFGIELGEAATYGVYSRLRCGRCSAIVGSVGDKLLPGLIRDLLNDNFDLYAAGLIGCKCGYQAECARALDPARAHRACERFA